MPDIQANMLQPWTWSHLEEALLRTRIEEMDALIERKSKENDAGRRLTTIPGVVLVTATAVVAPFHRNRHGGIARLFPQFK